MKKQFHFSQESSYLLFILNISYIQIQIKRNQRETDFTIIVEGRVVQYESNGA